ncbi:hypothetical protein lerEdw1_013500, partial [Lerista edwardsae]
MHRQSISSGVVTRVLNLPFRFSSLLQEPLQEWSVGPLEVREERLDVVQGEVSEEEIFRGTQQDIDGEGAVQGIRIAHPTSLLPPEHLDMIEDELSEVSCVQVEQGMNPSKTGGTLHMVEQTPMQSSQGITFWNVLQEEDENVVSLDDEKETQLKMKNSQIGGNEPEVTPRGGQGRTPEKLLVTTEMQEERWKSNTIHGTVLSMGCEEFGEITEGLGAACSNPSPVDIEGEKASLSKYGRRYCPKFDEHPISQMEVKNYDGLKYEEPLRDPLDVNPPFVGPLDVKQEPLYTMQGEISKEEEFSDAQQNVDGEAAVPGTGPTLLHLPEGRDVAEAELTKIPGVQVEQAMNLRKMEVPFHMAEWTLMQSSQQTAFWKILEEDGENVDAVVKKEETFLPDPVQSLRLPGQGSDVGKGTQLKVKNSQVGGNESVETLKRGQGRTQEEVLVTAEVQEGR